MLLQRKIQPIKKIQDVTEDEELDQMMKDLDEEIQKYKTMHENEDSQKKNQRGFS